MTDQDTTKLFERLPQTVVPIHYDLTIQPFLDTFKFNGNVIIDLQVCFYITKRKSIKRLFFQVKEPTNTVILYAAELQVDQAKITSNSKGKLDRLAFIFN